MRPMRNPSKHTSLVGDDGVALAADPAPSLLSYRMQRLWLTPLFRVLVRVGLPTFGVLVLIMMFLTEAENRDHLLGLGAGSSGFSSKSTSAPIADLNN